MATRRGFMATIFSVLGATALRPLSRARAHGVGGTTEEASGATSDTLDAYTRATEKLAIPLEDAKALRKVGGSTILEVGERRILFVRDSEETVRAFAPACTHRQVTVKYDHKNRRLNCPAHGSRFDLQGEVLRGPAKEPLPTHKATLAGDRIILTLEKPPAPAEEGTAEDRSGGPKKEVPVQEED
jgi:Rieske Fe-S protein